MPMQFRFRRLPCCFCQDSPTVSHGSCGVFYPSAECEDRVWVNAGPTGLLSKAGVGYVVFAYVGRCPVANTARGQLSQWPIGCLEGRSAGDMCPRLERPVRPVFPEHGYGVHAAKVAGEGVLEERRSVPVVDQTPRFYPTFNMLSLTFFLVQTCLSRLF
ncbi:hypothetical protein R1flu_003611 [Riccia fluitans]|uniref:Uncharacterized protein n=1 Tax=Riccia fluitans TaxID=41844 RepID=A0ABD1Y9H6_9MARC